jgi:predicted amidohydrolase YtcJ
MKTVFQNGRIFVGSSILSDDKATFQNSMVIEDGRVQYVGPYLSHQISLTKDSGSNVVDLQNQLVIPGFIDAHVHILHFGLSLHKVDLRRCQSLEEIRLSIKQYAGSHPSVPRILCKSWRYASTDGKGLASMIDDLDERPILIEASDLHSTWCNTAALEEMQVNPLPNPPGGTIHRDEAGRPSGLLSEAAHFDIVWPFIAQVTTREEKIKALESALTAYTSAGYTGLVDMAMDEDTWGVLQEVHKSQQLPLNIAVHWLVPYTDDRNSMFRYVDRAITLNQEFNVDSSPRCYVAGIKLIGDGVIDGCTAALHQPYSSTGSNVDPIWPQEAMLAVVQRADAAGLQCAIHAIGDRTATQAIDVLASVANPGRRHRIEHLELTTIEDAKRLGALGITASVQPVHLDPAGFTAWPGLLGPHRCERAFAYKEFREGGAPLAFGTDAPTARYLPLPNLYNATTRRSARQPESTATVNEKYGLSLVAAVTAASSGAAYSCRADHWTGQLKPGYAANFVVLETDWNPQTLLQSRVCQTWFEGKKVFDAAEPISA